MNFKLTITLLFVLAFVALGVTWIYRVGTADKEETTQHVFPKSVEKVTAYRLLRGADVVIALTSTDDKWMLTAPVKAPADSGFGGLAPSTASMIQSLSYESKFAPEESGSKSLATVGLETPRFTLEVTDQKGDKHELLLGKRSSNNQLYARVAGDATNTVYVLTTNPLDSLQKEPFEFRTKQIAALNPDRVDHLVIQTKDQTVDLQRKNGVWEIVKPVPYRADNATVSTILGTMQSMTAKRFAALPPAATGLAAPKVTVTAYERPETAPKLPTAAPATEPAPRPVTVMFGEYADLAHSQVYAGTTASSDAVLVAADDFSKINKDLSGLRDPVIMPVDVNAATAMSVFSSPLKGQPAAKVVEMTKDGDKGWKELTPEGATFTGDDNAVATVLRSIKAMRANKFVEAGDLKSIGLDPPMKRVVMTVEGHEEELEVGEPQTADPLTPVMRKGDATVYMVQSPELVAIGNASTLELRDRVALRIGADSIAQIALSGGAVKNPTTLVHAGGKWIYAGAATIPATAPATTAATGPAGTQPASQAATQPVAPDLGTVLGLLNDVASVQAQRWIGPNPMPQTAPDALAIITANEAPAATTPATTPAAGILGKLPETGPLALKSVTYELRLFKKENDKKETEWSAYVITGDGKADWAFVPAASLVEHVTVTDYSKATLPPAGTGGGMPPGMSGGQ